MTDKRAAIVMERTTRELVEPDHAFQARLGDRSGKRRVALGVVMAVAIVAVAAWTPNPSGPSTLPAPTPSPAPDATGGAVAPPSARSADAALEPGRHALRWGETQIHLTVPVGWSATEAGTAIYRSDLLLDPAQTAPTVSVHSVMGVSRDVCAPLPLLAPVGPSIEDLVTALTRVVGVERLGPIDVQLGGFPARRFVLTLADSCPGPESGLVWNDAAGGELRLRERGSTTVYVVDVNGDRLVIVSRYRRFPMRVVAELERVVGSIEISAPHPAGPAPAVEKPVPADMPALVRRRSLTVGDVRLSFDLARAWEGIKDGHYASRSVGSPEDAEAIVSWTSPTREDAPASCPPSVPASPGVSATAVADAVAQAPGTELLAGPVDLEVGGRAAKHVALRVIEELGCSAAFFHPSIARDAGATWSGTRPGDTIRVWIVDVDAHLVLIAAETRAELPPELEREIERIVASVHFED